MERNYPEVATLQSTISRAIIAFLKAVFARHGESEAEERKWSRKWSRRKWSRRKGMTKVQNSCLTWSRGTESAFWITRHERGHSRDLYNRRLHLVLTSSRQIVDQPWGEIAWTSVYKITAPRLSRSHLRWQTPLRATEAVRVPWILLTLVKPYPVHQLWNTDPAGWSDHLREKGGEINKWMFVTVVMAV